MSWSPRIRASLGEQRDAVRHGPRGFPGQLGLQNSIIVASSHAPSDPVLLSKSAMYEAMYATPRGAAGAGTENALDPQVASWARDEWGFERGAMTPRVSIARMSALNRLLVP